MSKFITGRCDLASTEYEVPATSPGGKKSAMIVQETGPPVDIDQLLAIYKRKGQAESLLTTSRFNIV